MQGKPVEFKVTLDHTGLARIQQSPRWRRKAEAAAVEIADSRAALVKHMVEPGQNAFAGVSVLGADEGIQDIEGQSVGLQNHNSLDRGPRINRAKGNKEK